MYAKIQSVQCYPVAATVLTIDNVSVSPGQSATYWWQLRAASPNDQPLTGQSMSLTGDAYAAWGNDDDYLYTYTAAQLGLTIVEIVPDAPPAPEPTPPAQPADAPATVEDPV